MRNTVRKTAEKTINQTTTTIDLHRGTKIPQPKEGGREVSRINGLQTLWIHCESKKDHPT
jgi:hypothetical protein